MGEVRVRGWEGRYVGGDVGGDVGSDVGGGDSNASKGASASLHQAVFCLCIYGCMSAY